jgi:hypothetical protein
VRVANVPAEQFEKAVESNQTNRKAHPRYAEGRLFYFPSGCVFACATRPASST